MFLMETWYEGLVLGAQVKSSILFSRDKLPTCHPHKEQLANDVVHNVIVKDHSDGIAVQVDVV
jgi:hypothetical protein